MGRSAPGEVRSALCHGPRRLSAATAQTQETGPPPGGGLYRPSKACGARLLLRECTLPAGIHELRTDSWQLDWKTGYRWRGIQYLLALSAQQGHDQLSEDDLGQIPSARRHPKRYFRECDLDSSVRSRVI